MDAEMVKVETMRVRTRIVFEVEYPLNTEFYDADDEDGIIEQERKAISEDPQIMLSLYEDIPESTIDVSVEVVL